MSDTEEVDQSPRPQGVETRQEIIRAAHRLLWERPFRETTVGDLMKSTSVGRSSFYIHFKDRYELAAALLKEIDQEITAATPEIPADARLSEELRANLVQSVAVWERHGPVIRGIAEASSQDPRLEHLYRSWFLQRSIDRTSHLVSAAQSDGRLPADVDPVEFSSAATIMAIAYLNERLGRVPQATGGSVAEVLATSFRALLGIAGD